MDKLKKKDLNNLRYYISERERLIKDIDMYNESIVYGYPSLSYDEVKSKGVDNDKTLKIIMHNEKIQKILQKREKRLTVIIIKLIGIIKKIDDPEIRNIVELRAVKGLTWERIGEEVHMEKTTAYKKYKAFIEDKTKHEKLQTK